MLPKLLVLALVIGGCGTFVMYTPLEGTHGASRRRPSPSVDVYLSGPPTDRAYRDVGLLEAEQMTELSLDDTREMLTKLRAEAARRGCDAIFVKGVGSEARTALDLDHTSSVKTLTATCICYTD